MSPQFMPPIARVLKCPSCGAPLEIAPGKETAKCGYCGSSVKFETPAPPPPPTIIIEKRRHHEHRHRLRRIIENLKENEN